jgi:hypothetical protein
MRVAVQLETIRQIRDAEEAYFFALRFGGRVMVFHGTVRYPDVGIAECSGECVAAQSPFAANDAAARMMQGNGHLPTWVALPAVE